MHESYRTPQEMHAATVAERDPATVVTRGTTPTAIEMCAAIDAAQRAMRQTDLERLIDRCDPSERITAIVYRDDWENPESAFHFRAGRAIAGLRMLAKRNATIEVAFWINGKPYRLAGPAFRPDNDPTPLLTDRRPDQQVSR